MTETELRQHRVRRSDFMLTPNSGIPILRPADGVLLLWVGLQQHRVLITCSLFAQRSTALVYSMSKVYCIDMKKEMCVYAKAPAP